MSDLTIDQQLANNTIDRTGGLVADSSTLLVVSALPAPSLRIQPGDKRKLTHGLTASNNITITAATFSLLRGNVPVDGFDGIDATFDTAAGTTVQARFLLDTAGLSGNYTALFSLTVDDREIWDLSLLIRVAA